MSYTQHTATATCTIANVLDVNDLCSQLYDYLTNHEDEALEELADCDSFESFADVVERYVDLSNEKLTISMDTEEINSDNEIFDFLSSHYAYLMTSKFMKITWVSYDSREGLSADVMYYDNTNSSIDVEALILSR
jgi:predicted CopG family antitoxin